MSAPMNVLPEARASVPTSYVPSPLHVQWEADLALRRRMPLGQTWRGCLGLAVLLDDPDATIAFGDRAFLHNDHVRWMCLRDIPPGRCPASPRLHRRDVNYARVTRAELKFGMPALDFRRAAADWVDFRVRPRTGYRHGSVDRDGACNRTGPGPQTLDPLRQRREFAVLNRLSAAMTRFACAAMGADGRPLRPAWARHRPADVEPFTPEPPSASMPVPYLMFPVEEASRLYDLAVDDEGSGTPWFLPKPFRQRLCRELHDGLRLRATEPSTYCGSTPTGNGTRRHGMKSTIDGLVHQFLLPADVTIRVDVGATLEPDEPWAELRPLRRLVTGYVPDVQRLWAILVDVHGGPAHARRVVRLWFERHVVRLAEYPRQVLIPADLCALLVRRLPPQGLTWDTLPTLAEYDWEAQAAVLPPLRQWSWDGSRIALPHDVELNVAVGDRRFVLPETRTPAARRGPARHVRSVSAVPVARAALRALPEAEPDRAAQALAFDAYDGLHAVVAA